MDIEFGMSFLFHSSSDRSSTSSNKYDLLKLVLFSLKNRPSTK